MRYVHRGWFRQRFREQFAFLRRQFLQDEALPFGDALSETIVAKALEEHAVDWVDRIYSPLVTLWVFLGRVLSQDHSCRAAVARSIAHRVSRGQPPCSPETGAYCHARKQRDASFREAMYQKLLDAVVTHRVADRPDRFEPRQRKRRQKKYDRMVKPRHEVKREMLNRLA